VQHDGTRFALADADAATTQAEYVVVGTNFFGAADKRGTLAKHAVVEDTDAPLTLGGIEYLSTTAGGHSTTRVTGDDDAAQIVGRALTTAQLEFDITQPRDRQVPAWHLGAGGTATIATEFDVAGSDNWVGMLLNADDEQDKWGLRFPSDYLSTTIFEWLFGADTAVTPSFNYSGIAAHSGENSDVSTAQTITAAAITGSADFLEVDDISSLVAAVGGEAPDAWLAVKVDHSNDSDAAISLGVQMTARCAS
jgi:hypothetical protein